MIQIKEEKEEVRLKNVVDKKILETRIGEFGSAADRVGAKAKENSLEEKENDAEEIDGKEIVEQVPVETEEKRSGLVKKSGPDGSRVETIEEVSSRRFKSVKEAKEQIMAIIFKKPPVKKEKEGEEAGQEAVARVLKYRQTTIENLGLAEVFPKH